MGRLTLAFEIQRRWPQIGVSLTFCLRMLRDAKKPSVARLFGKAVVGRTPSRECKAVSASALSLMMALYHPGGRSRNTQTYLEGAREPAMPMNQCSFLYKDENPQEMRDSAVW